MMLRSSPSWLLKCDNVKQTGLWVSGCCLFSLSQAQQHWEPDIRLTQLLFTAQTVSVLIEIQMRGTEIKLKIAEVCLSTYVWSWKEVEWNPTVEWLVSVSPCKCCRQNTGRRLLCTCSESLCTHTHYNVSHWSYWKCFISSIWQLTLPHPTL